MIYLPESSHAQNLACPDCGKHTIVRHGEDYYVCLHCNWSRHLNHEDKVDFSFMSFAIALATGFFVLLML